MDTQTLRCRSHNRGEARRPFQLFQIAMAEGQQRARRDLIDQGGQVAKGAWSATARPFAPGLYCQHCVNDGSRAPMDFDAQDLRDFGLDDAPLIFQAAAEVQADALAASLAGRFGERVQIHELPAQEPRYADSERLGQLHAGTRRALGRLLPAGGQLYAFQAAAIDAALAGRDVVVTTPTASGKSLTYTVPVLDTLLRDPSATALYISPLVALTEDQLNAVSRIDAGETDWYAKGERFSIHNVCRTLDTGAGRLTVARYDGQVSEGDREEIRRRQPQYILTTPDMLHAALLDGATSDRRWQYLFRNLRYVVIDELHTYRGVLGAGFANLLRRLQRLCRLHGAAPRFLCASATLVEPASTVARLIGREPAVVDAQGAGAKQHRRKFVLINGSADDETPSTALTTQAKKALLHLLGQRVRTIAFARSISEINDIYRFTSAELRDGGISEAQIRPFMRELLPADKRAIIRDLREGRLNGVISTTALSMGIDIGSLSAAVIIGFPGSIAQLWQQAGRAGRAGEGVVALIAASNPLDQFFVQHPDVLFKLEAEPLYCNPDNPYIVRGHLLAAARELPLRREELAMFGGSAEATAQALVDEGLLAEGAGGALALTEQGRELSRISFRNIAFSVAVVDAASRNSIVEVDAARAQRALHLYAHYQHIDRYYRVTRCDLDWRRGKGEIQVQEVERPEFTTTAKVERETALAQPERTRQVGSALASFGMIQCATRVLGYYEVPLFARGDRFPFRPLGRAAPAPMAYATQALWLTCDPATLAQHPEDERAAGLYSLAGAMRMAAAIEALCDPADIDALGMEAHPDTGKPTLLLYDAVPGGVGIAEAAFARLPQVLARAAQILAECPFCAAYPESRGCPSCVTAQYGDERTINRHVALALARALGA